MNNSECIGQIILKFKHDHRDVDIRDRFDRDNDIYLVQMSDGRGMRVTSRFTFTQIADMSSTEVFRHVLQDMYDKLKEKENV